MNIAFRPMGCCGLSEMSGIACLNGDAVSLYFSMNRPPVPTLPSLMTEIIASYTRTSGGKWPAHIIFTQAMRDTPKGGYTACKVPYGEILASFIEEERLGTVNRSTPAINKNSSGLITTFVWAPDQEAIEKWAQEHAK